MMQKGQNNDQLIELGQDVPAHSHKGAKAGRSFSLLLNTIFSRVWKNPLPCICIVLLIASLTFCLVFAPMTGRIAGTAIGSWQGVSQGISEGNKAGTAAGLSAEDTTVKPVRTLAPKLSRPETSRFCWWTYVSPIFTSTGMPTLRCGV